MNSKNDCTFDNGLTSIGKTRVIGDRNLVNKNYLSYKETEIFFNFNDNVIDNIFNILIVGSSDIENPYFGGFFFFSGKFPDQYPFFPPKLVAKTQGSCIRFHPNFYINGKCCLSILGTWAGPPWTSCQNIGSLSHTIKSLFIKHPITQEPGWEDKGLTDESIIYSRIIEYSTLEIAVIGMITNPPQNLEYFVPIMKGIFLNNYDKYITKLDNLMSYDLKTEHSKLFNLKVTYNIKYLKNKYIDLYKKLNKKKSPNKSANELEINTIQISENDGCKWTVKETKTGNRWYKYKQ